MFKFAPETRGRTLEELEDDFRSHDASHFEHEAPQGVYGSQAARWHRQLEGT